MKRKTQTTRAQRPSPARGRQVSLSRVPKATLRERRALRPARELRRPSAGAAAREVPTATARRSPRLPSDEAPAKTRNRSRGPGPRWSAAGQEGGSGQALFVLARACRAHRALRARAAVTNRCSNSPGIPAQLSRWRGCPRCRASEGQSLPVPRRSPGEARRAGCTRLLGLRLQLCE